MKFISFQFRKLISLFQNFFSILVFESSYTSKKQSENVFNFLINRIFSFASTMISKQRKRKIQKQTKLKAAKFAFSTYFDFFNSIVINDDSEWNIFSEFTSFLQRLQQFQRRYRESDLFDLLQDCLMNFALNWFKNQSKFISLHDFHIILTNAFFLEQINNSFFSIFASDLTSEIFENSTNFVLIVSIVSSVSSVSQKQQKLKISISNRCQWCQLNYKFWNSHRFQYFSCVAQNQQTYDFVLQFLEKHANEIIEKLTISILFDFQKQQKLKSTSKFQNIDIFDSTFTYENRRFNEITNFLQHFQQCRYQYKKSNLFFLLSSCFYDFVFDIWFDKQTIMKSTFLNKWIEILRIDFANVSFAKIKISKMICIRCNSNFNLKKKHREHVRKQHAKKSINCLFFSIDTVKSICEIEKNLTIIEMFVLQILHILFTISRNHVIFEIISSKSSNFSIETFKIVSKFMKNVSNQKITNIRTICKLCEQNFNFNRKLYEHIRNYETLKLVKNSYFSINAINLICEIMKKSIVIDSSVSQKSDIFFVTSKQKFEFVLIFETVVSFENSHFSFNASEIVSESMKNKLIQYFFISSKSSFSKIFESERQEISAQKFYFIDAFFSNDIINSTCEIAKNSTRIFAKNVDVRANSKIEHSNFQLRTFEFILKSTKNESNQRSFVSFISFFSIFKRNCSICRIDVFSIKKHYFEFFSCHETLRHKLKQQFVRYAHQRQQKTQKQIELIEQIFQKQTKIEKNYWFVCFVNMFEIFRLRHSKTCHDQRKSQRHVDVAIRYSISITNFTNIFANIMFENLSKTWIFEFSHQNLHTKSRKNQHLLVRLFRSFRLFFLQHQKVRNSDIQWFFSQFSH